MIKNISLLILIFLSQAAFANTSEHAEHIPSITDIGSNWINFLLYVGLMYKLLSKPISNGWAARKESIKEVTTKGRDLLLLAEEELYGWVNKKLELDAEKESIKQSLIKEANLESETIAAEAIRRASDIKVQSNVLSQNTVRKAEGLLEKNVTEKIVAEALKIAKTKHSKQNDSKLLQLEAA